MGDRNRIPSGVWALGFVSMLMDISSEMIHALLPLFMVTTLGASAVAARAGGGAPRAAAPVQGDKAGGKRGGRGGGGRARRIGGARDQGVLGHDQRLLPPPQ